MFFGIELTSLTKFTCWKWLLKIKLLLRSISSNCSQNSRMQPENLSKTVQEDQPLIAQYIMERWCCRHVRPFCKVIGIREGIQPLKLCQNWQSLGSPIVWHLVHFTIIPKQSVPHKWICSVETAEAYHVCCLLISTLLCNWWFMLHNSAERLEYQMKKLLGFICSVKNCLEGSA